MKGKEIGLRIETRRKQLGLTLDDIAKEIGVARSTIQRYEKGTIEKVKLPVIEAISRVLNVDPAWVCGKTDSMGKFPDQTPFYPLPPTKEWPVLGATACGEPLHRETPWETVWAPADIKADVVFRCVGNSMINARIFDGDVVFIKYQKEVENGEIAVVRTGDKYTLKRFYRQENYVELRPENPTCKPITLRGEQLDPDNFQVIGRAVAFMSQID